MRKLPVIAVLAAIGAALAATPAVAAVPGGNLLVNPGAEGPPTLEAGGSYGAPQGWTLLTPGEGDQGPYDSCYGGGADGEREVVERSAGDAIGGGARFFFGGRIAAAAIQQEIAVGPEAASRTLLIGGDFGGYQGQADNGILEAQFLDSEGLEAGTISTVPVSAAERGGVTAFVRREATGTVPTATRAIRFLLTQTRLEGSDNDGYADNLYATFDPAPPAPPTALGDPACPLALSPAPPAPAPAPAVRITKGPAHETAQTAAVFQFTGTAGGSYECSLDGGRWKPCSSGRDFGPVRPGDHRFEVREKLGTAVSRAAAYSWTVDLPRACVLRVARARVFVFAKRDKARLVIHYTSYRPATVNVSYALKGSKGSLSLGAASAKFKKVGVFRLPVHLDAAALGKVRGAKSFSVRFRIAKTPRSCGRYYGKRLTIPKRISGQTVWFQSDSTFVPGA